MSTEIYRGDYGIAFARVVQFCDICKQRGSCVAIFGGAHSSIHMCVPHFTALFEAILKRREFKP